jgi:hypothetical protein
MFRKIMSVLFIITCGLILSSCWGDSSSSSSGPTATISALSFGVSDTNSDLVTSSNGTTWTPRLMNDNIIQVLKVSSTVTALCGTHSVALATNINSANPVYTIKQFPRTIGAVSNVLINKWATDGAGNIVGVGGAAGLGLVVYYNGTAWVSNSASANVGASPLQTVAYGVPTFSGVATFVAINAIGGVVYNTVTANVFGTWAISPIATTGFTVANATPVVAFGNGYFVTVDGSTAGKIYTTNGVAVGGGWASSGATLVATVPGAGVTAIACGADSANAQYCVFGVNTSVSAAAELEQSTETNILTTGGVAIATTGAAFKISTPMVVTYSNKLWVAGGTTTAATTGTLAFSGL